MPLTNFGLLNDRLARCAQPDAVGFDALRRLGFLWVAKLNTEDESPSADEAAAMGPTANIVTFASVDPFVPNAQTVTEIVHAIAAHLNERPDRKIVAHCTHGMDRTGLICAGYRIVIDRWSVADAWEEFERYNRRPILYYRSVLGWVEQLRDAA